MGGGGVRFALCIEYDGSTYQGWQSQPHGQTLQDHLERALSSIAGERIHVVAAGRTDAGVHAHAQIIHFDTLALRPLQAWVRGVNAHLPGTIAVRWARAVAEDFHARFCARNRSYRYILYNHPIRPALQRGRVGWYHRPLDAQAMAAAAVHLLGEHDFSTFRASECQARSPVKTLLKADVSRRDEYLVFEFQATGFLHHMVRNMVGALLWVGYGKETATWFPTLLAARNRTLAPPTFMPDGLYFVGVDYDIRWNLPQGGRIIAPLPSLLI
ncbi:MAG: tRNA pseudouridine(38-40) synthase TruA [Proteobacteria bacterium]|nr:tRNA pseudouridine(38-40) synthase TruA [Pseudomonadota bacterium]HQR04953.1 tRNA pseudouridine(38-40) synthase TruA [Rhodocyclaceae bacterium]